MAPAAIESIAAMTQKRLRPPKKCFAADIHVPTLAHSQTRNSAASSARTIIET
jgi:hypothetical protein